MMEPSAIQIPLIVALEISPLVSFMLRPQTVAGYSTPWLISINLAPFLKAGANSEPPSNWIALMEKGMRARRADRP